MENELEQLGERIAEQAAHLDAAMHRLLTDLREFDERGGWHVQGPSRAHTGSPGGWAGIWSRLASACAWLASPRSFLRSTMHCGTARSPTRRYARCSASRRPPTRSCCSITHGS